MGNLALSSWCKSLHSAYSTDVYPDLGRARGASISLLSDIPQAFLLGNDIMALKEEGVNQNPTDSSRHESDHVSQNANGVANRERSVSSIQEESGYLPGVCKHIPGGEG